MKKLPCLLLSLVITAMAISTQAQQNSASGGERLFPMVSRVLTDQQRQSLQQLIEGQRTQIRPLVDKLQTSRQAMLNQVVSGAFDENQVRQYATQSASAEADLTVIFARALSHMQPPLSAQQIAQIKNFSPGRLKEARKGQGESDDESATAPEVHLKLPPPLPQDTNGLPIVN